MSGLLYPLSYPARRIAARVFAFARRMSILGSFLPFQFSATFLATNLVPSFFDVTFADRAELAAAAGSELMAELTQSFGGAWMCHMKIYVRHRLVAGLGFEPRVSRL